MARALAPQFYPGSCVCLRRFSASQSNPLRGFTDAARGRAVSCSCRHLEYFPEDVFPGQLLFGKCSVCGYYQRNRFP